MSTQIELHSFYEREVVHIYTLEELAQAIHKEGALGAGSYYSDVDGHCCTLGLMYREVTGELHLTLASRGRLATNIETLLLRKNDDTPGSAQHRAEVMERYVRELDLSLGGIS